MLPSNAWERVLKNRWAAVLLRPSVLVLLVYVIYSGIVLYLHQYDATVFIQIGRTSLACDPGSSVAKLVREIGYGPPYWEAGFDGQFYYYIALDPLDAWRILDANVRYQRILYPLIVRLLSLDYLPSIPALMIVVNLVSIFVGTELLARLLRWFHVNSWYSLGYGLNIGELVCLRRDLPEPLMLAFVMAAICCLEARGNLRLAGVLFSLALFTKETAIFFVAACALALMLKHGDSLRSATVLVGISILPYVSYQLLLLNRFGQVAFLGVGNLQTFNWIPFYGMFQISRSPSELTSMVILMIIPASLAVGVFFSAAVSRKLNALLLALLFNALFLVFLPPPSAIDVFTYGRVSLGLATAWLVYAGLSENTPMLIYSIFLTIPFQSHYIAWML